ncbi:SUKH-4 family immunity protein [Streptomyces sp. NPDC046805]|uniref:SUKH-4 family immunity protein n=1 Tax=Streptomyces sp. NPDC046805 TaxID=3155134 RepID=UPI0033E05C7E
MRTTEGELDWYVTHLPELSELSGSSDLLRLAPWRVESLCTPADVTDGHARLAEELRDRLVLGTLLGPAPLETLLRFAAVTEELAGLRGRLASLAGRRGTKAVTETSRRLLALLDEGTEGEAPPYGKAAALFRPLALTGGADSGLALCLPARLLGRVARFEEVDFPATLTHEPTRRFLRDTGLPEDAFLLRLDAEDSDVPLPTLAEYYADTDEDADAAERAGAYPPDLLPSRADRLIRLGRLAEGSSLVVDGATGAVLYWSEPEATLHPLNTDVSTLACALWLRQHERTTDACDRLAAALLQALPAADPAATATDADWHYWTELLQNVHGAIALCSKRA